MNPNWDTIVIGGGPAGSTTAGLLSKGGQKVLLLEKDTFPRFHIGESLIPYGNDVLHELGVWSKLEQTGFMPKLGAEFTLGNAAGFQRYWFGKNLAPRYAKTFQVERAKFDHILLQHAEEQGTTVLQLAKMTSVEVDSKGVTVAYDHEGASHKAKARWIVDGSGRTSVLGQALKVPRSDLGMPKKIAVFSHFRDVLRNDGDAGGHITIVRLEHGWFWFIPLDKDKTSVGLVQTISSLKSQKLKPEESFQHAVENNTEIRFRMKNAERLEAFRTEADYTFRHNVASGNRWLLAGDAAGFIDPIFSSGVMVALRSSQLAARAILKADAQGRGLSGFEQWNYTRRVKKMTSVFLDMIRMFYDRNAFEVFMGPNPRLDMPRAVLNLVAGNTDLTWDLQWRVWVFYTMCKLQKYIKLAPRLSFAESPRRPKPVLTT
ncbi:MAG: NAD(P)/FAD-dependent oxidoreductase [Blastochloris sp.]|nr:NAD(P)/FAD-dependent oxidoreductase [Blastochloris sp.]